MKHRKAILKKKLSGEKKEEEEEEKVGIRICRGIGKLKISRVKFADRTTYPQYYFAQTANMNLPKSI